MSLKRQNSNYCQTSHEKKHKDGILICTKGTRSGVIAIVAKKLNWQCVDENDLWNINWSDFGNEIAIFRRMKRFQRINHFPGMQELCKKDLLARNLQNMQKKYPELYQFFPKTWLFPSDLPAAINYCNAHSNCFFILKPESGARGNGIVIVNSLRNVNPYQRMIGQLYIERPLLIDDFKFDLRVYVLITSIDPLRVFVYNEGLMRLATKRYKRPKYDNISDKYMHLTNYSINKHSLTYSREQQGKGSKRTLKSFNNKINEMGFNTTILWSNIDDLIIKTILSAWPILRHQYKATFPYHDIVPACFEVLGFDIIIGRNLFPCLLEVNHSPSLNIDEPIDRKVKYNLIKDTLELLKVNSADRPHVLREDKIRVFDRLSRNIKYCASKEPMEKPNYQSTNDKWLENVQWEESHMGNYRQIMPCADMHKYTKLITDFTNPSIFLDTISSSIRKSTAAAAAATAVTNSIKFHFTRKLKNIQNKHFRYRPAPLIIKQNNAECVPEKFTVETINVHEENRRKILLAQREKTIFLSGIASIIYQSFDKNNLLSETDRNKYGQVMQTENSFDTNS